MRKIQFTFISLLLTFVLIACSSDEESEQANSDEETTNEEVNNEETDETQEEDNNEEVEDDSTSEEDQETNDDNNNGIDEEEKEKLLERFPDHLRLGESGEFERNDITHDHVSVTVNSFKFADEVDGEQPENDHFLLVNVTVENLLNDYNYEKMFIKGLAEGRDGDSNQDERDELAQELNKEEPGITTGDLVFDMNESDYYTLFIISNDFLIFTDEQSASE